MEDGAVGRQDERGGLQVPVSLPDPRVTADRAGYRLRVEPVGDRILESQLPHEPCGILRIIGGEPHDPDAEGGELLQVILEVSQLLTTMASKMAAVEEQDRRAALQSSGQAERPAVHGVDFKVRKAFPNLTGVH